MKRRFILAALLVVAIACPAISQAAEQKAKSHSAITPECRRGGHLKRFKAANERLKQGNVDMLFFGDSITAGWASRGKETWDKYYAPRNAVNLGRSGERTEHVLWQLENLDVESISPKMVVLLIGTNNVHVDRNTPEETIEGIREIVQKLRKKLPKAKIMLMGLLPRGPDNNDAGRKAVKKINRDLEELHNNKGIVYLDLRDRFVNPHGAPTNLLRSDHLHITPAGYQAWAEGIEPVVASLVGPLPGVTPQKPDDLVTASPEAVDRWRKMRLGLFVHWGPVSVHGTEIGWLCGAYRRGKGGMGSVPVEVYDNLYKQFNPTKFDAEEWVRIAKDAGMKYMVFTTKHHDGFCNFDTQQTDYKITSPESPYGRDIVKQLADACQENDLRWGVYYSLTDWYHPDYRNGRDRHPRYIRYLHAQMRELLTNYGKVDIIWFDLGGWFAETWDSVRLLKMCRELKPDVMINGRIASPLGSTDYAVTEGNVEKGSNRPWEASVKLCGQWAWKPNDRLKSLDYCIDKIARVAGADGNLMFNVGPMPDGRIEPRQVERLKEIGQWMKKYGESIYNTRGGPFEPGEWGALTRRDDTIYVHILKHDRGKVTVSPIDTKILLHQVLTGGSATVEQTDESITITLDNEAINDLDMIVALGLDRPAAEVTPGKGAPEADATGKK